MKENHNVKGIGSIITLVIVLLFAILMTGCANRSAAWVRFEFMPESSTTVGTPTMVEATEVSKDRRDVALKETEEKAEVVKTAISRGDTAGDVSNLIQSMGF